MARVFFISVDRRLRQGNHHLFEASLVCIVRSQIEIEPEKGFFCGEVERLSCGVKR